MSSARRPWYPWYPKDFIVDEKVQSLSDDAELLYRRILDVLWQANDLQMLNNCTKIANAIARGWTKERFENAWNEVQTPGFELLKESKDGNFVYSSRLLKEAQKIETISKTRAQAAKAKHVQSKSRANAKHMSCHTDTDTDADTDIKNPPVPPCPVKKIIALYHEALPELPRARVESSVAKSLKARWKEDRACQDVRWWEGFFYCEIRESDFLMGKKTDFQANLGWIVGPKNFSKIMNGQYRNRTGPKAPPKPTTYAQCQDAEKRQKLEMLKGLMDEHCNEKDDPPRIDQT